MYNTYKNNEDLGKETIEWFGQCERYWRHLQQPGVVRKASWKK